MVVQWCTLTERQDALGIESDGVTERAAYTDMLIPRICQLIVFENLIFMLKSEINIDDTRERIRYLQRP